MSKNIEVTALRTLAHHLLNCRVLTDDPKAEEILRDASDQLLILAHRREQAIEKSGPQEKD